MKKNKIAIISAILAILIGIFAIYWFVYIKEDKETQTRVITNNSELLNSDFEGQANFDANMISEFDIPIELPNYIYDTYFPDDETIEEIVGSLNMENTPNIAEDVRLGTTYFWGNDSYSLMGRPRSSSLSYSLNYFSEEFPTKHLSEREYIEIARNILVNNFQVEEDNLSITTVVGLNNVSGEYSGDVTTLPQAQVVIVNFAPKLGDFKVITEDPIDSPISVQLLSSGELMSVGVVYIRNIQQTSNVALKNFDELKATLGQAKIIEINNGNIDLSYLQSEDLKNIKISTIEIAYLTALRSKQRTFTPIFIIKGEVELEELNGTALVTAYLSATK